MRPLLFLLLLLHFAGAAPIGDDDVSAILAEENSLVALRDALNSSRLNSNWTGPQCILNFTDWYGLRCVNYRVVSIELESVGLSGQIDDPHTLANLTELAAISFRNNLITGTMLDFSSNLKLATIDMSMNWFTGPVSGSLLNLNQLRSLQLQYNKFSGPIPPLNQTSLKSFNVSYNELSGRIPSTATLQSFDKSAYFSNPELCGPPSSNPCSASESDSGDDDDDKGSNMFSKSPVIVAMFVVVDIVGLVALLWTIYVVYKRRRRGIGATTKEKSADSNFDNEYGEDKAKSEEKVEVQQKKKLVFVKDDAGFDLDDLLKAPAESLGQGNFGASYKATLDDDRAFVVKRVRDVSPLNEEEFGSHMRAITAFEHPNLFPLLGYYYSIGEKLLVYNLAVKGNLFDRIHGGRGDSTRIPFSWSSRLSVAKHIARAMEFLHRNTKGEDSVPHGNLKASNVLLASDNMALVSDYGLLPLVPALLAPKRMAAYLAPEYQHNRRVCKKSDVWSLGCLLLELVTRKFPAQQGMDGAQLVNWVHQAVREEWTCEVFDAEIAMRSGAIQGMFKLLQVALWCCDGSVNKRPEMAEVVQELEAILPGSEETLEEDDEEESL